MRFSSTSLCLGLGLVVAACGGDGGNDVEPALIAGGGVGSGAIDGEVNVFVIDGDTDAPIAGATVRVAPSTSEQGVSGTTDSSGLVTITDVSGPQVITVTAADHAASTWIGVNGANVTIPLDSTTTPAVDTAQVSGTIEGWETMPMPAMNHYRFALILYSQTNDLGDPANNISQPGTPPPNLCAFIPGVSTGPCNWELTTRTGPQAHYAVIFDGDSNGTPFDTGDDVVVVEGFAVKRGLDLSDGETITGEVLEMVPDTDLVDVTVAFPTPPAGLDQVGANPALQLGDEGQIVPFFVTFNGGGPYYDTGRTTAPLPAVTGVFAGTSWNFLVIAQAASMTGLPQSVQIVRDADIMATVTFPAFLAPPTNVTASMGTYSFTPANGAALHTAEFRDADGDIAWNVGLLDGSTSFTLPTLTPDPLPAGDVSLSVLAFGMTGFDPQDFAIEPLIDSLDSLSQNQTDFSH